MGFQWISSTVMNMRLNISRKWVVTTGCLFEPLVRQPVLCPLLLSAFALCLFFLPLPLCQVCHRVHSMYTSLHACFGDHFGTVTSEQEERMKGKLEWKLAHSPGNQSKREKEQQCSVVPLLVQIWLAPGRRGWWKERKENSLGKGGSQSPPESKVHYLKKRRTLTRGHAPNKRHLFQRYDISTWSYSCICLPIIFCWLIIIICFQISIS